MVVSILRPWAFVFILPAVLFCAFRLKSVQAWLGVVDARLLESLLVKTYVRVKERLGDLFLLLCVASLLAALVGVSLESGKGELYHPKNPAVIVLDMSLSMKVRDVPPNRFSQAVFKVYDLLDELKGIPCALIVFTDEPYQLIPATADKSVIEAVLPLLSFNLMPSQGSRTDRAVAEAVRTITDTGAKFGDIFLITDGADDVFELQDQTEALVRSAAEKGVRLFVLGVGTPEGGGLFEKEDIPILNALGNPVIHRLKEGYLKRLAHLGGGEYARIQTDDSDIASLMKKRATLLAAGEKSALTDRSLNDSGYWFLILPLIGFPFLFRKGRLFIGFFAILTSFPARAELLDQFLSPAALSMRYLERGNQERAIKTAMESGDFIALYNVGTRLIFLEKYPQAIELLEKAVQIRSENENAQVNLEIAKRLNENPPDQSPNAGENEQNQNQDQSGGKKGNAEEDNNLNQNSNNSSQDNDNSEKNSENKSNPSSGSGGENDTPTDSGNGEDGSSGSGGENDTPADSGNGEDGSSGSGSENDTPADSENGEDGSSGSGSENDTPADSGDSERNASDEEERQEEAPEKSKMIPVHEDPLTLLRHKILFLHREKRYNGEQNIGARW